MNSKYKFLCVILACVLILPLFSSCAGIGDGALFDNITTGEKKENSVTALEVDADAFCQIYPGMSPGGTVTTNSVKSLELGLRLLSEEYLTDIDRDAMEKSYFELIYSGPSGKHYVIYSDDFVFEKVNKANLDTNDSHSVVSLGKLTGAYAQTEEAYLDTLNAVTEEELGAGFKLNCLQVEMKPEISRTFILSDFEDIGGFYLLQLPAFESSTYYVGTQTGSVMVYFKSCTLAELEEKLNTVKKMSVVASANKIHVDEYYGTAFAE